MPSTVNGTSLDDYAIGGQEAQFDAVVATVTEVVGGDHEGQVHRLVDEERQRFADAKVNAFVPILVERAVRERLSAA